MKFSTILLSSLAGGALAFHVALPQKNRQLKSYPLFEATVDEASAPSDTDSSITSKESLLDVAQSLKDEYGALIIDSMAQEKLKDAVEALENDNEPPVDTSAMIGEWTLLCSTASADKVKGVDTSKLPFFNADPVKEIRSTLNKSLKVKQLIKSEESDGIDRVDHVIEYMPPNELSEFVSNLPDFLQSLNINPLQVTDQKVVLVHKAEVESVIPYIKTKLTLDSVVVNVAGKSQALDPDGADILGLNVPFGEFLNSGTFDTTYMDDDLRISRSKVGIVDQLRVFVRSPEVQEPVVEEVVEEATTEEVEAPSDVEDAEIVAETPSDEGDEDGEDGDFEAPSDVE